MAWLLDPGEPEIVLSQRQIYRFADKDLFHSAENAESFTSGEKIMRVVQKVTV
jgi:hypothetical protein